MILLERHKDEIIEDIDSALLLGDLFIRQNKAFKAQRLLQELQFKYKNESKLELFKIKLMAARGKQDEALSILDNNLEKYKESAGFLFTYALMNLQAGKFEKALKSAEMLSDIFPDEAEVYNLKAGILIRQGNLNEAKTNILRALDKSPTLFSAKFNLAATESRLGNTEISNKLVDELLILSPQHNETLLLRAFNLTKLNRYEEAQQIYLDILTLNPSNINARERVSELYQQQRDVKSALYHLDLLLKDNFDNASYLLRKAQLLIEDDRISDAEKTLNVVKNFISSSPDKLILYSELMRSVDNNDEAKAAMARAHDLSAGNVFITLRYASLLLDLELNEDADKLLSSIGDDKRGTPVYYFLKGRVWANKGESLRAVRFFKEALELDPRFAQAIIGMYNFALNQQHVELFLETTRSLVDKDNTNLLTKNLLAQYLFFIGEYEESISLYKQLVSEPNLVNPAEAYNRLAIMSIDASLEQASEYANKAYSLQQNSADILDTLGHVKALQGEYEESLKLLRDAFARNANDPKIRYHLGYTLAKLNRVEEAKQELNYAVNVERPFYLRPQAQALLDSLSVQ